MNKLTGKKKGFFLGFLLMLVCLFAGCQGFSEELDLSSDVVEMEDDTAVYDEEGLPEEELSILDEEAEQTESSGIKEDGTYTSKDEVAAYIHEFGHLPSNFITKKEAKSLGWDKSAGNLGEAAPGKSIGGDYFGNYEEVLPKKDGREYHECDIDFDGSRRGAKRIVFSNDGLIYYTEDHYKTFTLLYGEEQHE